MISLNVPTLRVALGISPCCKVALRTKRDRQNCHSIYRAYTASRLTKNTDRCPGYTTTDYTKILQPSWEQLMMASRSVWIQTRRSSAVLQTNSYISGSVLLYVTAWRHYDVTSSRLSLALVDEVDTATVPRVAFLAYEQLGQRDNTRLRQHTHTHITHTCLFAFVTRVRYSYGCTHSIV